MRFTPVLATLLAATTFVAAQPAPSDPPPAVPPGTLPPIVINVTNNNNGNNSNTNTQTNTAPVTVSTPVSVAPGAVAPVIAPRVPHGPIERIVLHPRTQRWIMLGVTAAPHGGSGARASIDVLARGAFSIGIDGATDGLALDGHGGRERAGRPGGGSVGAYLAWTGRLGPLDLRAQLGIATGGGSEQRPHLGMCGGDQPGGNQPIARSSSGPDMHGRDGGRAGDGQVHAEAAVLVGLPLGRHLGLVAGPVLTSEARAVDVTGLAGVRYGF